MMYLLAVGAIFTTFVVSAARYLLKRKMPVPLEHRAEMYVIISGMTIFASLISAFVLAIPFAAFADTCETHTGSGTTGEDNVNGGYYAVSFVASNNCNVSSITLPFDQQSSVGQVSLAIWSDNAGSPGSILFDSALTNSSAGGCFTGLTANVSGTINSGTTYWVGWEKNTGAPSNFFGCLKNSSGIGKSSSNGSVWSVRDADTNYTITGTTFVNSSSIWTQVLIYFGF